ncbi:MAG: hypothetical protein WB495_28250 [Xanthobacteraceae bacterium]
MSLRRHARIGIALAAAYAFALQAVLLAFGIPSAGGVAAVSICSAAAGHSTPAGQSQDCLEACLTLCCRGAPICLTPAAVAIYAPAPAQMLTAVPEVGPLPAVRIAAAHRSRAPPSG